MKRIVSFSLALAMLIACCGSALASYAPDTRASLTLAGYSAGLSAGSSSGELIFRYDVCSSKYADAVGVESIEIYKANGMYVTTIYGSTSNGLIRNNSGINKGTYNYTLTSGTTYYAIIKVFAEASPYYDSREVTTKAVKAP